MVLEGGRQRLIYLLCDEAAPWLAWIGGQIAVPVTPHWRRRSRARHRDHLKEHCGYGMVIDDETIREDLCLVDQLMDEQP